MRLSLPLLSLALLSALVSAAPIESTDLAARGRPGGGYSAEWKRSCPNGSNSCQDDVEIDSRELAARGRPGGGSSAEWKRSCPNGSQACGDAKKRSCTGGGHCSDI